MSFDPLSLDYLIGLTLAATGTVGHFVLIDNLLKSKTVTISGTTLTATAHGMVTGTKVRLSSSVTQPTSSPAIAASTNVYLRSLSANTFSLHTSLAGAIANTGVITFSDSGAGTLTVNEQALDPVESRLAVIANHEIVSTAYTARFPWTNAGAPVAGTGRIPTKTVIIDNSSAVDIVLGGWCFIWGGTSVIGNTTGNARSLNLFSTSVIIPAFESLPITFKFSAKAQTATGALVP